MVRPLSDDIKSCPDFQAWLRCHEFKSPGLWEFRNVFTKLMQYHFLVNKKMIDHARDGLSCTFDDLTVKPGNIIDPGNTNNVPGIIITTGEGIQLETPWISAQIVETPDYATLVNVHQGTVTMSIMCLHYDPDIVAMMSDEVMDLLVSAEALLWRVWNWMLLYKPLGQSSPRLSRKATDPEAFENYYESTANVQIQFEYGTTTREESRRMQDYMLVPAHK